ncbi:MULTISPECIES: MmgE/PrpD family protein [unclassified Beijerinckia]|uniref:MmgE/PrpD family protein n=1 Tax=unclassified Beijerinckia TaxID=2638183 RepID=UPI00147E34EF|nr:MULTISPECIES: MmgE/PrpD family protein [unclassified Beijerinckia]
MAVIEQIAEKVLADPVPSHLLTRSLIDIAAAMLAGGATSEAGALRAHFSDTAWSASVPDHAALAVAMTRLSEVDDIHMSSCTTPGSVVVPVALVAGAQQGASPEATARGIAAGYRIIMRLGMALDGPRILYRGIWPTYLLAPIGAAVTASVLFGGGPGEVAKAIALGLNQISGGAGAHVAGLAPRWLLAGQAAASGLRAARAIRDGFSADTSLLDGDWLQRVHGLAFDRDAALADVDLDALSLKPICAAKQTIAAVDGFRQFLDEGVDPAAIESVRIGVPKDYVAMIGGGGGVAARMGRMTSVAYQCGLAAYEPALLTDVERIDRSQDPRISALMTKISVEHDSALDGHFPRRWPARVHLSIGGQVRTIEVIDALGDPGRPLENEAFQHKFLALAAPVAGKDGAERLFAAGQRALSDVAALRDFQAGMLATILAHRPE